MISTDSDRKRFNLDISGGAEGIEAQLSGSVFIWENKSSIEQLLSRFVIGSGVDLGVTGLRDEDRSIISWISCLHAGVKELPITGETGEIMPG